MAQEGRSTITDQTNSTFPDNNQKLITAEMVRAFMDIINESKFNLKDDSISDFDISTKYGDINIAKIINSLIFTTEPLFYVDIRMYVDSGSERDRYDLLGYRSDNPSVTVSASNTDNLERVITINYSEYFGGTNIKPFSYLNKAELQQGSYDNRTTFVKSQGQVSFEFNELASLPNFLLDIENSSVVYNQNGLQDVYRISGDSNVQFRIAFYDLDSSDLAETVAQEFGNSIPSSYSL